jgi:hypothetical protein
MHATNVKGEGRRKLVSRRGPISLALLQSQHWEATLGKRQQEGLVKAERGFHDI